MTRIGDGRRPGQGDRIVLAAAVCCLAVSAGGTALVALRTGADLRVQLEYRLPLTGPVFFLAVGLGLLGLLAMWSLRMWRGSAVATRWVRALLVVLALLLIGSGLIPQTAAAAFVVFVVAGVMIYLVAKAKTRLEAPEPAALPAPVHPVVADDLESAAAQRPYPHPAPLTAELKRRHLDAVQRWRMRGVGWLALAIFGGVIPVFAGLLNPRLWSLDYELIALMLVGGMPVMVFGVFRAVDPVRRMYRHIALLRAYGVRLDDQGREDRSMPTLY